MTAKVSVLLPVYNGEAHLERTLRGVLDQTLRPHEIIVVDDGSTDRTPDILSRYKERLRILRVGNGGVSRARNTAMAAATGDWFAFIDHDDVWFKNKLERQVLCALKYPEVGLVCSNYFLRSAYFGNRLRRHYDGLRLRAQMRFDGPMSDAFGILIGENFVGTSSAVLIRSSDARKVGEFDVRLVVSEDYQYWLRLARLTGVIAMSEPLFYKRTHRTNLSNDLIRIYDFNRRVLKDIEDKEEVYLRQAGLKGRLRASRSFCMTRMADELYRAGRLGEAYAGYRRAFMDDPGAASAVRYATVVAKRFTKQILGGVGCR